MSNNKNHIVENKCTGYIRKEAVAELITALNELEACEAVIRTKEQELNTNYTDDNAFEAACDAATVAMRTAEAKIILATDGRVSSKEAYQILFYERDAFLKFISEI